MVGEIRIYVEGGGDSSHRKAKIRIGFRKLFDSLAQLARAKRIRFNVVACGGRQRTYDSFVSSCSNYRDAFNILLVDSEGPVSREPWQHLHEQDGWPLNPADNDQCHLMVEMMEAWFIADSAALSAYFGTGFAANALPQRQNVEEIPKAELEPSLNHAARNTPKQGYKKIRDGSAILARLNSTRVRKRARHCERLFTTLEGVINGAGH